MRGGRLRQCRTLKFVDPQHMGGVFSEEAERPDDVVPDVDEEEQTPAAPPQPVQDGGGRRRSSRRQTHHRSRAGNKRKTIRNRTKE